MHKNKQNRIQKRLCLMAIFLYGYNRKVKSRLAQSVFEAGVIILELSEYNLHLLFQQSYHERSKLNKKIYLIFKNCVDMYTHTRTHTHGSSFQIEFYLIMD